MKNSKLTQWWMTDKFPLIHLNDKTSFAKKWLFHPIKRRIARWYLILLRKFTNIKIIGITGSAGKTTTKEMLASILKIDGETIYSKENIDPIYNIPTTILNASFGTKYLVLEMGVEYPGEMDFYLWLAKPDIGIVTNIFPTHTQYLGGIEGVLKEKSKLVLNLSHNSVVVLNSKDLNLKKLSKNINSKVEWFESGDNPIENNAFAAATTAKYLGFDITTILKGLENYNKPKHRLELINLGSGAVVLDDSYNSNPKAYISSLKYFVNLSGDNYKIIVVGDMLELGDLEEKSHREIGRKIAESDVDVVIGVGKAVKNLINEIKKENGAIKTYLFSGYSQALPIILPLLKRNTYIFIKGSRSIGLDRLVRELI